MKDLKLQFIRGEQVFTQEDRSTTAYLYEVTDGTETHYEVFTRRTNSRGISTYPRPIDVFSYKQKMNAVRKFKAL